MKFSDMLRLAVRYKTALIIYSLCVLIAFSLYFFVGKKTYRSQAELLVSPVQEQTTNGSGKAESGPSTGEAARNELRVLASNDALLSTAKIIAGQQASYQEVLKVRAYIGERLKAGVVEGTDVIRLAFDFPDPYVAQRVLRTIIDQYRLHRNRAYFDASEQTVLQSKLDTAREAFTRAQENLLEFERGNTVFDERQLGVLNETREQLQLTLNGLGNEYAYTLRKRDYIQELLRNVPGEVLYGAAEVVNEKHVQLTERLDKAIEERDRQLHRQPPDPRALSRLEEEIRLVERLLRKEPRHVLDNDEKEGRINEARDILNRQLLELLPEVEAQQARMDNIRAQVAEIDEALVQSAMAKDEHAVLLQDMEQKKAVYDQCLEDYSAATGDPAVPHSSLAKASIIASPSFNPAPVSAGLPQLLPWAILLLVVGNSVLPLLCLSLAKTVSTPLEAEEAFRIPVAGVFEPELLEETERDKDIPYFERCQEVLREIYLTASASGEFPSGILFTSAGACEEYPSVAEAFASYMKKYHQKKPVVIRYPAPREKREDMKPGPVFSPGAARFAGLPVYVRPTVNVPKERMLWEKLRRDCDLLLIEYVPMREGELLLSIRETVRDTFVSLTAESSEKSQVRETLAVMRRYGFKASGLLLHKEGQRPF